MTDAFTIAAGGLHNELGRFDAAAAKLGGSQQAGPDQIVALQQARIAAGADAAVMQIARRLQRRLLDILA